MSETSDIGLREVCTNFDRSIDREVEAKAKADGCECHYTAWNFFAVLLWNRDEQMWLVRVMQYRNVVLQFSAASLELVMERCCDEFGYE